ncbi:hypothetical protein DL93DRAFT_2231857 [Clavulina sp. PMI_390]|nr:hypothetical protein DL93DRAFT_2231857 [Clavulina sp. PMI_390]
MGKRPTRGGATSKSRQKEKQDSLWGWVLSEVSDPDDITREHVLQAYGFSKRNATTKPVCPNSMITNKTPKTNDLNGGDLSDQPQAEAGAALDVDENGTDASSASASCSKSSCTSNPNCLNYVEPGVLHDEATAWEAYLDVANIGEDPSERLRSIEGGQPVGLRNLGATCYVNAYLQVWFRNKRFVQAVMQCSSEDPKFPNTPIHHLQVTFAAMQSAKFSVYNPTPLVESLALNPSEQQDALEFSKLLLSLIADEFKKQQDMGLQSFVGREFQGTQIYGVECNACGTRSERPSEFLELEINLQSADILENSLRTLLQDELLTGANKYFCGKCEKLQNARRYSKLSRLPPVLQFGIMRFQYDPVSDSRKKKNHLLSIPTTLDMTPFIDNDAAASPKKEGDSTRKNIYRLQAILCHKGTSAYRGHYEAQLLDTQSDLWTNFNDEVVTFVGPRAGRAGVNQKAKGKQGQAKGVTKAAKDVEASTANSASTNGDSLPKLVESKDAYMLVYRSLDPESSQDAGLHESVLFVPFVSFAVVVWAQSRSMRLLSSNLPPPIARVVEKLNHEFEEEVKIYDTKKQATRADFEDARKNRLAVCSTWRIRDHSERSIVLPRDNLEEWLMRGFRKPLPLKLRERSGSLPPPPLTSITPHFTSATDLAGSTQSLSHTKTDANMEADSSAPVRAGSPMKEELQDSFLPVPQGGENAEKPMIAMDQNIDCNAETTNPEEKLSTLDSSSIKCPHEKLDPMKAAAMTRISLAGFDNLKSTLGESVVIDVLSTDDVCDQCVRSIFLERFYATKHPEQVRQFDEINQPEPTQGIWISKVWLKDWRKQNPKFHSTALSRDPSPEELPWKSHVYCPHGQLEATGTDRIQVTTEAATILQELFPDWVPAEGAQEPCTLCADSVLVSQQRRNEALAEKSALKTLPKSTLVLSSLVPGSSYTLVPASFLDMWHAWIESPLIASRPQSLDNSSLFCEHGLLNIDTTKDTELKDNGLAIVKREHWEALDARQGNICVALKYSKYEVVNPVHITAEDSFDGTVVRAPIEICHDCRASRLRNWGRTTLTIDVRRRVHPSSAPHDGNSPTLNVDSETLISLITAEDQTKISSPPSESVQIGVKRPLSASFAAAPSRRSKRLRVLANSHASRLKIEVGRQETVMDLKQKISDATDMPPVHQRLFLTPSMSSWPSSEPRVASELAENATPLEHAGVVAYDRLVVYMPEEPPRTEDEGNEHDGSSYRAFQGTALAGGTLATPGATGTQQGMAVDRAPGDMDTDMMDGTGIGESNGTEEDTAKLSCPSCTFHNPPDAYRCEMCDGKL